LATEGGGNVLTALVVEDGDGLASRVDAGGVEATVLQGGEVGIEEVVADSLVAEGSVFREASERVIDAANREIGRATEDKVELLADGDALEPVSLLALE